MWNIFTLSILWGRALATAYVINSSQWEHFHFSWVNVAIRALFQQRNFAILFWIALTLKTSIQDKEPLLAYVVQEIFACKILRVLIFHIVSFLSHEPNKKFSPVKNTRGRKYFACLSFVKKTHWRKIFSNDNSRTTVSCSAESFCVSKYFRAAYDNLTHVTYCMC